MNEVGEAVGMILKVEWRPQEVEDTGTVEHVMRKAIGFEQSQPKKTYVGCNQQGRMGESTQALWNSHLTSMYLRCWTWSSKALRLAFWVSVCLGLILSSLSFLPFGMKNLPCAIIP